MDRSKEQLFLFSIEGYLFSWKILMLV